MSVTLPEGESITWGVTVEQVSALAPHIGITDTSTTGTTVPDTWTGKASRSITHTEVQGWIGQVGARAAIRVGRILALPEVDSRRSVWERAAADAVANGAASYLVAAAFPVKAAPNEQTSYAEVLWRRFLDTIGELAEVVDRLPPDTAMPGAVTPGVTGAFPAPMFVDDLRA